MHDWQEDPFTRGAYAYLAPDGVAARASFGARTGLDRMASDMPGDVRRRWDARRGVVEVKRPSNKCNGMTYDADLNLIVCEESRIGFFENDHAWIIAEFPVQLAVTDIYRVNLFGAALQHTIGKTAG